MSDDIERRDFLKTLAVAGAGLGLGACAPGAIGSAATPPATKALPPASPQLFTAPPLAKVRVGFVGVGHQGTSHVQNFTKIPGVEIRAICDLLPEHVARAQKIVTDAGQPQPVGYSRGPEDYRRMCTEADVDLVFNATPWELHAPVMLAAMRAGKHAATEVPMAVSLDELWELVETAEQTRRHCVMMENCCYDRTEMMILRMVRQGAFGELLHAECGYLHDLRTLKLTDFYVNRWRVQHSIRRNGDLYPTHGIGPVAQWMNVNRGNSFDYLVSMASNSRGLNLWAAEHIDPNSAEAKQRYALGDVVTTMIRTTGGQTILVTHDTDSPRPYSRNILLQGTKGLIRKYPEEKIYLEGRSPEDQWEPATPYRAQYEHPIWKSLEERSAGAGHGGMDYIEDFRLVQSLRSGAPTDMDVYDGAACTSVIMLSERSIADRSRPQDCPDFTRGAWKARPPLGIVDADGSAVSAIGTSPG
ncbi:MAG TPA: Gfo/Idh/MocA family oxidoreductase [Gemmatimonadaceae bacterium]|nr:Gfo/Idh/MocA family oxidoreductase [Gemmatimonadaceae bacterium]